MSTFLGLPGVLEAIYAGNAIWHTSAVFHFGFRPQYMMRKLSLRQYSLEPSVRISPEGDKWHHDLMAYLGGINSSLALLAVLRLVGRIRPDWLLFSTGSLTGDMPLDVLALMVLGAANYSQAFLNFTLSRQNDRWICGKGLDRITILDATFTVVNWVAAVLTTVAF